MNGSALLIGTEPSAAPRSRGKEAGSDSAIPPSRLTNIGRLLEWMAASLLALAAIALHIRFVTHVGALWRDETNSVNIATLPSLAEVWHFLDYDSFPILYFAVLRAWTGVFGSGNDQALRALGLLMGLGILGALWSNARAFGSRLPLLSFALVGLNPMVVRYGDSNRAYGLGILLILLTLRSFWRLVESAETPTARRIAVSAVLAVLSVQCLYYNAVLLLAVAAGAAAVALRTKAWRTIGIIFGIGILAAVSLLPYAPIIIRMRAWTFMVSYPATLGWLWKRAGEVMGSPDPYAVWLWIGLIVVGLGVAVATGISALYRRDPRANAESQGSSGGLPGPVLFAGVTLVVGVVAYTVFLRVLNYYTQPWYYIALVAFIACVLDILFAGWPTNGKRIFPGEALRWLRPLVALLLLCFTLPGAWSEMPTRQTNVDLIAAQFEKTSQKGDVILVPRWECAITLCRYYQGEAEIITIPPIADHRFHRYDLILEQTRNADAYQPVLDRMEQALRSGHRVLLVDTLPVPDPSVKIPVAYAPYRDAKGAWHGSPYNEIWKAHAGRFLSAHTKRGANIEVLRPSGIKVQRFEELAPGVVEGWQ
ncbi:MAG: hypothetical protein ABI787_03350 [Spartobacteria bacterium]